MTEIIYGKGLYVCCYLYMGKFIIKDGIYEKESY